MFALLMPHEYDLAYLLLCTVVCMTAEAVRTMSNYILLCHPMSEGQLGVIWMIHVVRSIPYLRVDKLENIRALRICDVICSPSSIAHDSSDVQLNVLGGRV